ncbi:MAG: hypothetical protein LC122_14230 [Chitinophagales bacterium]|nr:hypothetical protein [Chitinophagales bacterium]
MSIIKKLLSIIAEMVVDILKIVYKTIFNYPKKVEKILMALCFFIVFMLSTFVFLAIYKLLMAIGLF